MNVEAAARSRPPAGGGRWLPMAFLALPLLLLAADGWLTWRAVWRQAANELTHTVDAAAELALRVMEGQQLTVDRINDLLRGLTDAEIRAREPELHAAFAAMLSNIPHLVTGYVLDRDGVPLLGGNVMPVPRDQGFADRDFFIGLRGPDAPRIFVGQVYRGRIDGAMFFAVARRRTGSANPPAADGFDGVTNVSVDPKAIGTGLGRLVASPGDGVVMLRRDGMLLARFPVPDQPMPQLQAGSPLLAAMQAGTERGTATGRSPVDGTTRLLAYRRLEGWPAYAVAARDRTAILLDWAALLVLQLAIGVPVLVAVLALGRLAVERARREAMTRASLAADRVRHVAAEALRESEARYRTLTEVAADVVWSRLSTGAMPAPQPSWEAFTGQRPSQYRGFGWQDAIHPADRESAAALWEEATGRGTNYDTELRLRHRDGHWRNCLVRAAPVPSAEAPDGRVGPDTAAAAAMPGGLWVGAHIDVTPLREAEARQRFLMHEIDHRAKNALSVVQAVLRLTRAPDRAEYVAAVEGRVAALARAQTVLAQGRWTGADLRVLLEGELAPFLSPARPGGPAVVLDGPPLSISTTAAQPLSMAVHELATNAVKHGALAADGGRVTVTWQTGSMAEELRLHWTESGGPPLAGAPAERGFGTRVLDTTLRHQLGGRAELHWRPAGLECVITLPLDRVLREAGIPPLVDDAMP